VTHRVILPGQDRAGFIAEFTALLDEHGANIIRVNAGKVEGAAGDQYIAVFAISLRDEKGPDCLAAIVHTAGELKLSFRYETA
jgi:glycine cleavage system regulatory protein